MAGSEPRKPVIPMVFPSQIARQGPGGGPEAPEQPGESATQVTVHRAKSAEPARVYVFRQPCVVVGRSSACDVRLDDPERVSSSRHAEVRRDGNRVQVVDLGSRNFTFVNGERLEPRVAVEVGPNDKVAISDSELRAQVIDTAGGVGDERTVTAPGSVNPFADGAKRLAEALSGLAETLEKEPAKGRRQALEEALEEAVGGELSSLPSEIARALDRSSDDD